MENWGLVMFRRVHLVYDERYSSSDTKLTITRVIAHELAHQVTLYCQSLAKRDLMQRRRRQLRLNVRKQLVSIGKTLTLRVRERERERERERMMINFPFSF